MIYQKNLYSFDAELLDQALKTKVTISENEFESLFHFMIELSRQVWYFLEYFDAKKPFGNINWEEEIIYSLITQNVILPYRNKTLKEHNLTADEWSYCDRFVNECFNRALKKIEHL